MKKLHVDWVVAVTSSTLHRGLLRSFTYSTLNGVTRALTSLLILSRSRRRGVTAPEQQESARDFLTPVDGVGALKASDHSALEKFSRGTNSCLVYAKMRFEMFSCSYAKCPLVFPLLSVLSVGESSRSSVLVVKVGRSSAELANSNLSVV